MSQELFFQIRGDFLTDHARDRVLSGRWVNAVRFLRESLPGISTDQTMSILAGTHRLEGVNEVELQAEPQEGGKLVHEATRDYLRDLRYLYAGVVELAGGRWWRPVAVVTSYGPEDYKFAEGRVGRELAHVNGYDYVVLKGKILGQRWRFYAQHPATDRAFALPYRGADHYVIFEEQPEPPLWLRPDNSDAYWHLSDEQRVGAALLEHMAAGRRLDERGHFRCGGHDEQASALDDRVLAAGHAKQAAADSLDDLPEPTAEQEELAHKVLLGLYRRKILEQAGDDLLTLTVERPEGDSRPTSYTLPRAPFLHWILWRTDGAHLAPPWQLVSPPGVKQLVDDPRHTDWALGMTPEVDLDAFVGGVDRDDALNEAAYGLLFALQEELMGFEALVLCGTGKAEGKVIHAAPDEVITTANAIVVVPNASPDYYIPAHSACKLGGAVIAATGHELAHLAVVGVEDGLRVVVVEEALVRYPEGVTVEVDCSRGRVEIDDRDVRGVLTPALDDVLRRMR